MLDIDISSQPLRFPNSPVGPLRPADTTATETDSAAAAPSVDCDAVTGIHSRVALVDALRTGHTPVAYGSRTMVLVAGLDRFRLVNEVLGDSAGDQLLAAVAERLRDWCAEGRLLGRVGSDEFAVVGAIDSDYQATAIAETVREVLKQPFVLSGSDHPVHLTACLGVATADSGPPSAAVGLHALRAATEALHDAKQRGPDSIEWFDEHRHHERATQFQMINDLHGAADRDEFFLVYQPIVAMDTVRPVAVEALLRWHHPSLGLVMPSRFVPLLEAGGLIVEVGEWVLRAACAQVAEWDRRLPGCEVPAVSVNVSAIQFDQAEFAETVSRALRAHDVAPEKLILELTEGTLLSDPLRAQAVLNELESMGVRVAVDDFGTGHSSLAYLKRLPVQMVKIDRAFVANLDVDQRDRALVQAILDLARALGLETIAEGIETRSQLVELSRLGCEFAQGFYWSQPVAPEDIEPWITGRMRSLAPRGGDRSARVLRLGGPDDTNAG